MAPDAQSSRTQDCLVSNEHPRTRGVHKLAAGARTTGRRTDECQTASTMGGEDGPADVAVGGHGCQLPPTHNHQKNDVSYRRKYTEFTAQTSRI